MTGRALTIPQQIHGAQRVEIKVEGCDEFVRIDKCDLHLLKDRLGGWFNFSVDLVMTDGGRTTARVTVRMPPL